MSDGIDIWKLELPEQKARSVIASRYVTGALQLIVIILSVVMIIIVGVMLGRTNPDISNAVRRLFIQVDSEREPVLPVHYPSTSSHYKIPDVMIVIGDGWAGGLGVSDTASHSWWAQLVSRSFTDLLVIRSTNSTAMAADISDLWARMVLPIVLSNHHIAIVVQCGWNDIVHAQNTDRLDQLNINAMASSVVGAIGAIVTGPLSKAASVSVYILDYPDVTAETGLTSLVCEFPLDRIYNHAGPVDVHLRALNMYSQALMISSHKAGYAFVPLRDTLHLIGSAETMRASQHVNHEPIGVDGHHLPTPIPAAFDTHCGLMGVAGQQYQADLVAAYFSNKAYFIVG